jgi:hypothetical protein
MRDKVEISGKVHELEMQDCCKNTCMIQMRRDDLKKTTNPEWRFCGECGRHWKKCIAFMGDQMGKTNVWIPMPFPWEK